jgi:hypothetical protein
MVLYQVDGLVMNLDLAQSAAEVLSDLIHIGAHDQNFATKRVNRANLFVACSLHPAIALKQDLPQAFTLLLQSRGKTSLVIVSSHVLCTKAATDFARDCTRESIARRGTCSIVVMIYGGTIIDAGGRAEEQQRRSGVVGWRRCRR